MKIKKSAFGTLSTGEKVKLFTVSNGNMSFSVTNFGCIITSILLPNKIGTKDDVTLGYSTLEGYIANPSYFGCLVGRFANRIGKASFSVGGEKYALDANDGGNCLHSGFNGYNKMVWKAEMFVNTREAGVIFRRTSPAGEQGFPGNVDLRVTYSLTRDNDIVIRYSAKTDEATPISLTNHAYFNLGGRFMDDVLGHELQLFADRYVPVDSQAIPLGPIEDVAGTPFDFRSPKPIGRDMEKVAGGFDHNWEINRSGEGPSQVAEAFEPVTGRKLTVWSTQPGVQFYSGNFLNGTPGKNGLPYNQHAGFCLETQHFPDAPNRPEFPNSVLLPGEKYSEQTIWHFDFEA